MIASIKDESQYKVDLDSIHKNRKDGVSGMMRVKNDAEFIEECIRSCIDALDELVIVYNNCTDNSPEIIKRLSKIYPSKIKVYEYKPFIYSGNLSKEEFLFAKKLSHNSPSLLSNYYNYTLSKTTYKYVMKIDADQIYFPEKLCEICDWYRMRSQKPTIFNYLIINLSILYIALARRLKISLSIFSTKQWWNTYLKAVKALIIYRKQNLSLSGINLLFTKESEPVIQLGGFTQTASNILPPYNGVGDHQIFKVTQNTYFIPHIADDYNKLNNRSNSIIERLVGLGRPLYGGLCWIHLNSNRKSIASINQQNFNEYPNRYLPLDESLNRNFMDIIKDTPQMLCSWTNKIIFSMIHPSFSKKIVKYIRKFKFDVNGQLIKI